jgi:hypothetical protein
MNGFYQDYIDSPRLSWVGMNTDDPYHPVTGIKPERIDSYIPDQCLSMMIPINSL